MGQQSQKALSRKPASHRLCRWLAPLASDCVILMRKSKANHAPASIALRVEHDIANVGSVVERGKKLNDVANTTP